MQTLLCTWKGAMQTLLRTWIGDIISGNKKKTKILNSAKFQTDFFQTTYTLGVYITYVTAFKNTNILKESTFNRGNKWGPLKILRRPRKSLGAKVVSMCINVMTW